MPTQTTKKAKGQSNSIKDTQLNKIGVFFKKSILRSILKILIMESSTFRNYKPIKNINKLFSHIDLNKYNKNEELMAYIWWILYISKQWLEGVEDPEIIIEMGKRQAEFDNIKDEVITSCINDPHPISSTEAKFIFDMVTEALQYGYIISAKDIYQALLDEISLTDPLSFHQLANRLFEISRSLVDIKHSTNMVTNKVEFNSSDISSIKEGIETTIDSLQAKGGTFKTGIKRLNTLLSPGYMNTRIYTFLGLPGAGKSQILLKSTLDIRKYNPGFIAKTPNMKPCVLYITMENTLPETIERIWNMTFDDPITAYSVDEATEKLCKELGIILRSEDGTLTGHQSSDLSSLLDKSDESTATPNIEIVLQYYPYRSINTDDLYTAIHDLRDENMEVCALVFDYIKRIEPSVPTPDNVKLELSRIINELKALAAIQNIPVITAHQMNRNAAATVDAAVRKGLTDTNKMVGREHVGDAWEIIESSDFAAVINTEYKPGTDEKFMTINIVKRRRVDKNDSDMERCTYLAHPYSKTNSFRLIDDLYMDKVLSLQSLSTDIDIVGREKVNATPRSNLKIDQHDFIDDIDD